MSHSFFRVYVELTNICGLKCSFCPPKILPTQTMSLPFFEHILGELKPYTKEIAYHVAGDSLALSNVEAYLDRTHAYGFKVILTTSGYFLKNHSLTTLFHPAIKQINISLNSFNKNSMPLSFEDYMKPILELCHAKQKENKSLFINLRLWNRDENNSDQAFNEMLFSYLENAFKTPLHVKQIQEEKPRSIRLQEKVRLHFDDYFEWPSLHSAHHSDGKCLGLSSHFGILSNGAVVPCCLDKDGVVVLGDLHVNSLASILEAPRTRAIIEGFKANKATEPLCQKCTYKNRFNEEK
ncbi:radical SAM/SPASM domain-containing protein [Sulfurospirillum deleyianum]|uniref:Radical SAM domain protein n=1 Tax=Sulfurospirillum deleyianum (strain ATCC 51133 / DSM 6946 / 5175) TaxID=525898 RepID=D1B3N5_SULD5|nr:radical SAM/SPASM domain-containing protein [Sulfurospirillum deleyianum]ACZ12705.1 Radical SAM domain protein [Sulfurospirillum deleyianum DSM 6946]